MSVDITSVPPWKQAILERKKRQEEDEKVKKDEEVSKFSQMPSWKRDILLKKQHQHVKKTGTGAGGVNDSDHYNNTPVIAQPQEVRRPLSPVSVSVNNSHMDHNLPPSVDKKQHSPLCPTAEFDYEVLGADEENQEHLLPIQANYWYRSDPNKRQGSPRGENQYLHHNGQEVENSGSVSPPSQRSSGANRVSWSELDGKTEQTKKKKVPTATLR